MSEARLFFLTGTDEYARNQAAQALIDKYFEPEWQDFNFERLDGESGPPESILEKWLMPPFGGAARLLVVDYTQVTEAQISGLLQAFADYLQSHTSLPNNRIIIQLRSLDKRKKESKICLKFADHRDFAEIKPWLLEKELHPWIEEAVRRRNKRISQGAVAALAQALGSDKYALDKALDKICLYLGSEERIDEALIHDLVPQREADVFKLMEYLAARNDFQARIQLNALIRKEKSLHPVIATLASSLRKIYQSKYLLAQKYSVDAIAKQLAMHPFRLKNELKLWQSFSLKELEQKLRRLLSLDAQTKRSSAFKPELALELWIYEFVK